MMDGVWFDNMHVGHTMDMIMNHARVGTPTAKIKEIEVPGMDGVLDITESLGEVKYNNRQISFKFTAKKREKAEELINALHGQKKKIVLDRDDSFYYMGRCSVGDPVPNKNLWLIEMTAACEPYRYKSRITRHKEEVNGASNIVLLNERMRTIPIIDVTGPMQFTFEDRIYHLEQGEHRLADVILKQGYNRFRVEGRGTILFKYQEGAL